ncbi:MAG TPA: membrane protein insertase YidC [Plasticicumulans sp.]|uniref:membrane protein insertase YidC n=1 Tax=Plasticicumulans sp. TaxID=2307179 RepID=UPI002C2EE5CC|nr:membrane protein insertase YidC [Plasticicumulans sp.]MBS0600833.1 membrane protein insertase YidC [Pseudomonadota bacterium]HMZ11750.1 membrane protein insertase YidC [Plasticicumulans sp.]HNF65804.1 membrane protein insertase YidC [Plasticicumulans sp.]HNG51189.1 membrane protein insertase YidC [Plasticicumulans sp.]HNK31321.1 membrane protein insertase YidC [Plasticicumulans sp.]
MENQRLVLVIALAFTAFLIWQQWITEHAPKPAPAAVATTAPATPGSAEAGRSDVPLAPGTPAATAQNSALARGARIKVTTDVYEAEIDSVGGDLRRIGLRRYPESLEQREQPFVLMRDAGGEVFVAQSGLRAAKGAAPDHYAVYTAERSDYALTEGQDSLVVRLDWTDASGVKVVKTYTFHRGSYVIDVAETVENGSAEDWQGVAYWQLQREAPASSGGGIGQTYTYTGGIVSTPEKTYEKHSFDDLKKTPVNETVTGGWVAMIQHYFLGALIPASQSERNVFYSLAVGGNRYVLGMSGAQLASVAPGASSTFQSKLYVGPKIQDRMAEVAPHLELTVDYGKLTILAEPLFWALKHLHALLGNWGWAIIVLTLLLKAAFYKLSETSYRSMANMRKLGPKLQSLKERYGDDKQKLNQAMMEMYRKEKINPLGGCLPIVVQIPVFIALYWMLLESVELRQAPFMGWIQDLSVKDPYYVLPLIMGVSMFVQQKLSPAPPDPVQAKVMMAMPVVFTFMFLWFPSGLVLYWVVNNCVSILQQWVITKRIEAGEDKAAATSG